MKTSSDFAVALAASMLASQTNGGMAAVCARLEKLAYVSPQIRTILKSSIAAGNLSDPAWAGGLQSWQEAEAGFVASMRSISVFDYALSAGMVQVPLRTKVFVGTSGAVGTEVADGAAIPASRATFAMEPLAAIRAAALLVVSNTLLEQLSAAGFALIEGEAKNAVAAATNLSFMRLLTSGAPTTLSSGGDAINVLRDAAWLFGAVAPRAASKLMFVCSPDVAIALTTMPDLDGRPAFPGVGPLGGVLLNTPLLVSDQFEVDTDASGRLALLDASQVAGGTDTLTLSASSQATIEQSSAPIGNTITPAGMTQVMTSMFQGESTAIKAIRRFGAVKLRDTAFAAVEGVHYTGT